MARADETGFKREQMDIRYRRLTHARRLHLQHAAIGKEPADFRHHRRAFQQIGNGCARLPGCRLAHGTFSDCKQGHEVYSQPASETNFVQSPADYMPLIYR